MICDRRAVWLLLDGTLVKTLMHLQAWRVAHQGNHGNRGIGNPDTQVAVLLKLDVVLEIVPPSINQVGETLYH